jgi:hypothetical protein
VSHYSKGARCVVALAVCLVPLSACAGEDEPPQAVVAAAEEAEGTVVSFTMEPPIAKDLSPAELEDLRFMAEQDGVTFEEELARTGNQQVIGELFDRVRAAAPRSFAGGELDGEGGGRIFFTGEVPAAALEELEASTKSFEAEPGPARFLEETIAQAQEAVIAVLERELPDVPMTVYAEESAYLVVAVAELRDHTVESLQEALESDADVVAAGVPLEVEVDPALGEIEPLDDAVTDGPVGS